jgi:RNA polymerase sigma factor (sigma-70 family)
MIGLLRCSKGGGTLAEDFANHRAQTGAGASAAGRLFSRRPDPLRDPAPLIKRVYAYVAYRIGDGVEAEDVTSEVFERATRYRVSYQPAKGEPIAWLLGIARRTLADRYAARAARPRPEADVPERADSGDLEGDTIQRLTLEAAIAALPERDQELLSLRYGADLRAGQIAAVMEMETHAVEVALSRALSHLRTLVADSAD